MASRHAQPPSKIDAPFAGPVLKRARALAEHYSVVVSSVPGGGGGWLAKCVELPSAFATAPTSDEAVKAVRRPLTTLLATMLELGRPLPSPMTAGKRDAQVNVKLTPEERLVVEGAAKKQGFKGLSDFFRFAALHVARA
ncbi:MAG: type II toxin-antitoxin system HicB family antitoxin [Phycisphaerales bacterium]